MDNAASAPPRPRHVVSLSLGSSTRNKRVEIDLLGQPFIIERVGTDGDYEAFCRRLRDLDGQVDAIGLGGINLALYAGRRKYYIRDAVRAIRGLTTPVVDGSGIKLGWERDIILNVLPREMGKPLRGRRVLIPASVDRFGMAETFAQAGADCLFGDFMFGLGLPIPLRSLTTVKVLAALLLPLVTRLPFTWLYPTGERQTEIRPKWERHYAWAEVIAGDFHYIHRHMPDDLRGKTILTNTITAADVDALRQRGLALLITTTPEMDGRSFPTNAIEATLVALSGKRPAEMTPEECMAWMRRAGFTPRIERLGASA